VKLKNTKRGVVFGIVSFALNIPTAVLFLSVIITPPGSSWIQAAWVLIFFAIPLSLTGLVLGIISLIFCLKNKKDMKRKYFIAGLTTSLATLTIVASPTLVVIIGIIDGLVNLAIPGL